MASWHLVYSAQLGTIIASAVSSVDTVGRQAFNYELWEEICHVR